MNTLELYRRACNARTSVAGKDTQYAIYDDGAAVYLSIEGSCDNQDWLFNFDFAVAPYKHMAEKWLVHRGFATAWKLARDQIAKDVEAALAGGNRRLVILGYSHGAALAVLAHEYFDYNGYAPETHAFGCPRVIWGPLASKVAMRFYGLVLHQARGDIVTMVPPAIFGYRHVGGVVHYGPKKFPSHLQHLVGYYEEVLA